MLRVRFWPVIEGGVEGNPDLALQAVCVRVCVCTYVGT